MRVPLLLGLAVCLLGACAERATDTATAADTVTAAPPDVFWNSATVYFLLLDRFANGDFSNDRVQGRPEDAAVLRGFEGGDLAGVRRKLEEGWFDSLGVTAIWMTPFQEQILGGADEGTGKSYGYHGYWIRDWTAVEPAFGTAADLRAVVDEAHRRGIRILMDAVINHTGKVTPLDPAWPDAWVRTGVGCDFTTYRMNVSCELVENLPDIRTERDEPVDLPAHLIEKWRREDRLDAERAELDAFFTRTGHPRAPRYYVIKWLTDWVREFGFDGYRIDTAKHFEEAVAAELKREAETAFADWKAANPDKVLDDLPFYVVGEVYGWGPGSGRLFAFGDRTVDFFDYGYDGLINFAFKQDATAPVPSLFERYATVLREGALRGVAVLNYISSHDDGSPYDRTRERPYEAATRLMLAPGGAQIYYGDELARPLEVDGARGDANLRSFMNWDDLAAGGEAAGILAHWRTLGRFRQDHPAVGIGAHAVLQTAPYVFSRVLDAGHWSDRVVVGMDQGEGAKTVPVGDVFTDGTELVDAYSGTRATVTGGSVTLTTPSGLVLLGEPR